MYHVFSWSGTVFKLICYFVLLTIVGLNFQMVAEFITGGALALVAYCYWQLNKLKSYLYDSKKIIPPEASGLWGFVYDGIYHLQRRHRKKRKELSVMTKHYREGAQALPDATVVVDTNGAILWCNKLARVELGLCWPQDSGRRIDNLIRHPDFIAFFKSADYSQPVEVPSPIDLERTLEYRIVPYGNKQLLLIARDVTRLHQLNQMRRDFVANVSHELRTPLTVVNGYLEMLPADNESPISHEVLAKAVGEMRLQSQRMQTLIEDLLVLSRIEASSEPVMDSEVDIPALLRMIEVEAKALNENKKHKIAFNIDHDLKVYGITNELRSALSNLIFNAIHYTPAEGKIEVIWQQTPKGARFAVVDNGEGIPSHHIHRLTERFYRVDNARSRATGGSGLGLAIVKHVLSHHHSKLEISSQVSMGSEFAFTLSEDMIVPIQGSQQKKA